MTEYTIYSPVEHHSDSMQYLSFGNGIIVDKNVHFEFIREDATELGNSLYIMPREALQTNNINIVGLHFLPNTENHMQVSYPDLVPNNEKAQIAYDCVEGFLSLAFFLKEGNEIILDQNNSDFYFLVSTTPRFAAFLKNRIGMRGETKGSQVWIRKSEFISDENIARMKENLQFFRELMNKPTSSPPPQSNQT